jgi:hypothetical protein
MDTAALQYSWPGELRSLQATLKAAGHLARFAVTSTNVTLALDPRRISKLSQEDI